MLKLASAAVAVAVIAESSAASGLPLPVLSEPSLYEYAIPGGSKSPVLDYLPISDISILQGLNVEAFAEPQPLLAWSRARTFTALLNDDDGDDEPDGDEPEGGDNEPEGGCIEIRYCWPNPGSAWGSEAEFPPRFLALSPGVDYPSPFDPQPEDDLARLFYDSSSPFQLGNPILAPGTLQPGGETPKLGERPHGGDHQGGASSGQVPSGWNGRIVLTDEKPLAYHQDDSSSVCGEGSFSQKLQCILEMTKSRQE